MTQTADETVHVFTHGGTTGAVIHILPTSPKSLNELLPEELQQTPDQSLTFAYTCCYVLHRDHHVMVDAGIDGDGVTASLSTVGVTASDIELVCITHVDRDHVAGLLLQIGDGELTYPNARYAIDAELWDELHKPETYDALPKHLKRLFERLKELIADRVIPCSGETELRDGLTFVPCPGHRPGHAAYEFATDNTPILHVGDAILNQVWVDHPDWPVTMDSDPEQAVESRQTLLDRVQSSDALILATHMP